MNRQRLCRELGIEPDKRIILSVGELNDNKNHETVIRALRGIENVLYLIAGTGDKKDELERVAKECAVDVRLLGFRTDVVELYTTCDLYVLPSFREGLNVSIMEAMACGADCLCSDIRGNRDLIDEREYRADSRNIDEWKNKVEYVLDGHSNRTENLMHIKGFSRELVNQKMIELYQS